MDIRIIIKEVRKRKKMSQNDVSTKADITTTTISNYETGKTSPDVASLKKIASATNTTLKIIFE